MGLPDQLTKKDAPKVEITAAPGDAEGADDIPADALALMKADAERIAKGLAAARDARDAARLALFHAERELTEWEHLHRRAQGSLPTEKV